MRRLVPGFAPAVEISDGTSSFALPCAEGAECRFSVYVYADGEPQITAEPRARATGYFWAYHFELGDYDSPQQQGQSFLAALQRLLVSPTRVVERQGFLWLSYTCLLERDGAWSLFGTSSLLLSPRLLRHRREYRSPAIAPAATPEAGGEGGPSRSGEVQ